MPIRRTLPGMSNAAPSDLQTLWELAPSDPAGRGAEMPAMLRMRYGGTLEIPLHADRPTLLVNFVTTLETTIDVGPLNPGVYRLAVRRQGGEWQMFPAQVR